MPTENVPITVEKIVARLLTDEDLNSRIGIIMGELDELVVSEFRERWQASQEAVVLAQAVAMALALPRAFDLSSDTWREFATRRIEDLLEDLWVVVSLATEEQDGG